MVAHKHHEVLLLDSLIAFPLVSWYKNLILSLFICEKGQFNFLIAPVASPKMSCPPYLIMMLVPRSVKLMLCGIFPLNYYIGPDSQA